MERFVWILKEVDIVLVLNGGFIEIKSDSFAFMEASFFTEENLTVGLIHNECLSNV